MDRYRDFNNFSHDWNSLQGYRHMTNNHFKPRRNILFRHISIENESGDSILISIEKNMTDSPSNLFLLNHKETKSLAVNEHGSPHNQVIRIFNKKGIEIGHPCPIRSSSNSYVIRAGTRHLFVHTYVKGSIKA